MQTALALSLLLFTSSTLAAVVGMGVNYNAADKDSWTRALEFLKATRK